MSVIITAANLVKAIHELPRNVYFDYPNPTTKTKVSVSAVNLPEGPITIKKYTPGSSTPETATAATISKSMLVRAAAAIKEGMPVNLDRVLGASYNTRSSLEALLAHTREFYMCYPGRIESSGESAKVKKGHKHFIWLPNEPHELGVFHVKDIDLTVSEIPTAVNIYEAIEMPSEVATAGLDMDEARRHIQIQLALVAIGQQLEYRTYVAKNDQGVKYKGLTISQMPSVINDLQSERVVSAFQEACNAGKLIDCVWFQNGRLMPAVMEVEHSTGITSGLSRMKGFKDLLPLIQTRWVIVAPDDDRDKVVEKANKQQFRDLDTRYFSYSAVEELYSLCHRRRLKGVSDEFLDCFMEPVVQAS